MHHSTWNKKKNSVITTLTWKTTKNKHLHTATQQSVYKRNKTNHPHRSSFRCFVRRSLLRRSMSIGHISHVEAAREELVVPVAEEPLREEELHVWWKEPFFTS